MVTTAATGSGARAVTARAGTGTAVRRRRGGRAMDKARARGTRARGRASRARERGGRWDVHGKRERDEGVEASKSTDGPTPALKELAILMPDGVLRLELRRAIAAGGRLARRIRAVKKATMPMKNGGNVVIGLLEEQDVDDATNLIMDLFCPARGRRISWPRIASRAEQASRARGTGGRRKKSDDRILLSAKVGTVLVGIAEISPPNGDRFAPKAQGAHAQGQGVLVRRPVSPSNADAASVRNSSTHRERAMANMGETIMYTHTKVDNEGDSDSSKISLMTRGTARGQG